MFLFYKLNQSAYQYLKREERKILAKAFLFGANAHEKQFRISGEPYFTHPVGVACILAGMKLDLTTIIASLLHDVIEDTGLTFEGISKYYGKKIAELVEGVTKLSKANFNNKNEQKAENLRKMILATIKDIRVIIIKLADRLHNMTTLEALLPSKRKRIATETLNIYAPIAYKLGMYDLNVRFKELAFKGTHPHKYQILDSKVKEARLKKQHLCRKILKKIEYQIRSIVGDSAYITSTEKSLYSIHQQMNDSDMSFSEIMDVHAYKVVTNTTQTCYLVLGAIHNLFRPIPSGFKDYIAVPKSNGYQSLHTTVFSPYNVVVKIHIQTQTMSDISNMGILTNWLYNKSLNQNIPHQWLKQIANLQQNISKPVDFINSIKIDSFREEVYVFTLDSKIIGLPKHATCVDFAYHLSQDIGNRCIGAKVNGCVSPLSYTLRSGDVVEIIISQDAYPNPSWLHFVTTQKAMLGIEGTIKQQIENNTTLLGKKILGQIFSKKGIFFGGVKQAILREALTQFQFIGLKQLYNSVGSARFAAKNLEEFINRRISKPIRLESSQDHGQHIIASKHLKKISNCCKALPNDKISCVLVPNEGIQIHQVKCEVLGRLLSKGYLNLDVIWGKCISVVFPVTLYITVENIKGAIGQIGNTLAEKDTNVLDFNIVEFGEQYATNKVLLEIRNRSHFNRVVRALKKLKICIRIQGT